MSSQNSFYSPEELHLLNFKSVGKNVLISKKASIYQPELMSIGNNVRIDDFCMLSGKISIKDYVHISIGCALFGAKEGIFIDSYSGLSARTTVYAAIDDFSGDYFANAVVDKKFRNINHGKVVIKKYVSVCTNCVILPNITLNDGCVIGAMSFVNQSLDEWNIYAGIPAKFLKKRKRNLLQLESELGVNNDC